MLRRKVSKNKNRSQDFYQALKDSKSFLFKDKQFCLLFLFIFF